ncbi:hypothetical protein E2C01_027375 [Portunus trituberculatus]|uniref:Uncharacterized protein n=1 Tax=Portunus trituberculatus TaxID=210409 RepID=A0A5B7EKN9_PORTR|nr:hypothetical protein [Portunus trituberculatus]
MGTLSEHSPPTKKPLPQERKPNLHSDRGQDSNPCAWRPLGSQSTHGSTLPRRPPNLRQIFMKSFSSQILAKATLFEASKRCCHISLIIGVNKACSSI